MKKVFVVIAVAICLFAGQVKAQSTFGGKKTVPPVTSTPAPAAQAETPTIPDAPDQNEHPKLASAAITYSMYGGPGVSLGVLPYSISFLQFNFDLKAVGVEAGIHGWYTTETMQKLEGISKYLFMDLSIGYTAKIKDNQILNLPPVPASFGYLSTGVGVSFKSVFLIGSVISGATFPTNNLVFAVKTLRVSAGFKF